MLRRFLSVRALPLLATTLLCAGFANAADEENGSQRFEKLESVKALDEVMKTLGQLRNTILNDAESDREASEGMRFVLRTLSMASEVTGDGHPLVPHFARMDTRRRKIGGDNPNAEYDTMIWDGRINYRIQGNIGTVDHLSFTVMARQANGRQKAVGYLNERDLDVDSKGNFTIWLSEKKPEGPGNWVETGASAGAGSILVRQYLGDRESEKLATYDVEVVGRKRFDPYPPTTDSEIAASIRGVNDAIRGLGFLHRYVSPSLGEDPNSFKLRNSDDFGADISSVDNLYVIGTYDFGADEALLVEVESLDVRFWNFAIENPWHESVDYWTRKSARTHDEVRTDADGKIRFVIAHGRTDHPNYLETGGHSRGFMTFRWVGERETKAPLPKVTRLPIAEAVALAKARAAGETEE